MPLKCCINGCNNSLWKRKTNNNETTYQTYPTNDISFHSFPKKNNRCEQWRSAIFYGNKQVHCGKNPRICSQHFNQSDIYKMKTNVVINRLAVPSVFPNSDYTEYEFIQPEDDENDENEDPNRKRIKLDDQALKLNASTAFFAPIMNFDNVVDTCASQRAPVVKKFNGSMDVESLIIDNDDQNTDFKAVPDIRNVFINASSMQSTQTLGKTLPENIIYSTSKSRKIRYPGDINEDDEMSPSTARENIRLCKSKIKLQANQIYRLKQTVKRQKKRIETLKELLRKIKTQYGISGQAVQSIESTFEDDIITQLKEGRKTRSYSENVKSFALTLHFYSNAAYQYIRRTFGKHLPSSSTLSRWYKTINGNPRISTEALTILKSMSDDMMKQNKTLFLTLMTDEMAIRTQLIWNDNKKQFIGYVDYGLGTECNDTTEEASDALVFMVVPINAKGKLPIAYYLTNKFSGEEKAQIVKNLLRVIDDTGADVVAFTFDGASSNISMAECLGANLNFKNMSTSFKNPYSKQKIHTFLDICHMMKLVRNNWAAKRILFDANGNAIKWEYIEKLERLQNKERLSLGTKLTAQHINFYGDKMKVRLAVQVLSRRVADALTYCKNMPEFKGCEATIEFVTIFNDLFDVLNSKSFEDKGYKHPFHKSSYEKFSKLFEKASKYICGLKLDVPKKVKEKIVIERKSILLSGVKRGFLGLLSGIKSFQAIYESHVSSGLLSFLLGYKFSQDHLETMFAVIRSKGGFNNNPNVVQFKSAFKRLLMRNQLTSSLNANCLNTTENFLYLERLAKETVKNFSCKEIQFYDDAVDVWEDIFDETNTFRLSEYAVDVVAYVAGFVERTLKKRLKCEKCMNAVSKKTVFTSKLIQIKNRGGLVVPQFDIFTVCRTAEKILWSTDLSQINFYEKISCRIMRQFVDTRVFCDMGHSSNAIECEHSLSLLKTVVSIYLKVRMNHIAKHHNINSKTKFVRSKCTKLVHFSHQ